MAAIKEAHKMDYIMETVGLRKAYKDNIVVDDVNMHISKGAIYGFVGPNGVNQLVQDAIRNQQSRQYDQCSGESPG